MTDTNANVYNFTEGEFILKWDPHFKKEDCCNAPDCNVQVWRGEYVVAKIDIVGPSYMAVETLHGRHKDSFTIHQLDDVDILKIGDDYMDLLLEWTGSLV